MTIELKIANEEDAEEWDSLVDSSIPGTIFHTWKWLRIMEKHTTKKVLGRQCKGKLYPIVIYDGSTPIGLFPLFYYKNLFKFVQSPPSAVEDPYLAPLLVNYDSLSQSKRINRFRLVIKEVDKFIKSELNPTITLFHSAPGLVDSRPFKWAGYEVEPRHTYIIELNSLDTVWNNLHTKLRKGIRKARKEGLEVSEGSREELIYIYTLLNDRNRIHASKEFVLDIFDNFYPDNLRVFIVEKEGERLSGIINTCFNETAGLWIGVPKSSIVGVYSNELLVYESIKWALENGYKRYDLINADSPSYYLFKSKFNGELVGYISAKKYYPSAIKVVEAAYRSFKPRHKVGPELR